MSIQWRCASSDGVLIEMINSSLSIESKLSISVDYTVQNFWSCASAQISAACRNKTPNVIESWTLSATNRLLWYEAPSWKSQYAWSSLSLGFLTVIIRFWKGICPLPCLPWWRCVTVFIVETFTSRYLHLFSDWRVEILMSIHDSAVPDLFSIRHQVWTVSASTTGIPVEY